jgi:hypothetical protein
VLITRPAITIGMVRSGSRKLCSNWMPTGRVCRAGSDDELSSVQMYSFQVPMNVIRPSVIAVAIEQEEVAEAWVNDRVGRSRRGPGRGDRRAVADLERANHHAVPS